QDIGTPFLDVLTNVVRGITGVAQAVDDEAKPSLDQLSGWFAAHESDITAFFVNLKAAALAAGQELHDDIWPAVKNLASSFGDLFSMLGRVANQLDGEKDGWAELNDTIKDGALLVEGITNDLSHLIEVLGTVGDTSESAWSNADTAARPFLDTLAAIESAIAEIIAGFAIISGNEAAA